MNKLLLTIAQLSDESGVSVCELNRLTARGQLAHVRLTPRGLKWIARADWDRYQRLQRLDAARCIVGT